MARTIPTLVFTLMASVGLSAASAQGVECPSDSLPHEQISEGLSTKYGEKLMLSLLNHNNILVEVYVQPLGDTWSIVISDPSGCARLIDSGMRWWPMNMVPASLTGVPS